MVGGLALDYGGTLQPGWGVGPGATGQLATGYSTLGSGLVLAPGAPAVAVPITQGIKQVINLVVTRNGAPEQHVTGVSITSALDMPVPQATVSYTEKPNWNVDDQLEIYVTATENGFPELRFHGHVKEPTSSIFPYEYTLMCRGYLAKAEEYQQQYGDHRVYTNGLFISQLMGNSDPSTWTDSAIISAVLAKVPGIIFDPADIGGTGATLPGFAIAEGFWRVDETALAFIQRIDHAALGFRTFESIGGKIVRVQVAGHPNNDAQFTFTEGIDIWEGTGRRIVADLHNAVFVQGYVGGDFAQGIISWDTVIDGPGASNPIQGDSPFYATFSDPFIERRGAGDPGPGYSAEEVAAWQLSELNRQRVELQMTTFRDDVIGPGQTHIVVAPHADVGDFGPPASGEALWVQRVEITVRSQPALFQQTFNYIGGGLADAPTPLVLWE